jgi:pSer/pThr/pTyr-binding forkhead associated (FHA) protein/tetratricopeptide (TPR) repeat protein
MMTDSSGREQEYSISTKPIVFGSAEDSDVVLGSRSIARHHMKVWEEDGEVIIEDLTGGAGLELNDQKSSGIFKIAPGDQLKAGVFVFQVPDVTAVPEQKKRDPDLPVPLLQGTKGHTKGFEIELKEGLNDIGRDEDSYVAINDQSISRLHAKIFIKASQYTIRDMKSSNGTFVNDKRVTGAKLQSGDIVRFGNMEFSFVCGDLVTGKMNPAKKKKLVLIAALVIVVIFVLVGLRNKQSADSQEEDQQDLVEETVAIEVQVEQHLKTARIAARVFDWDQAGLYVDKALALHPISKEARQIKVTVGKERENKRLFDEAMVNYDLDKWSEALASFEKIPESSAYYTKVKYKISEIKKKLSDHYLIEGKSFYSARDYKKAHENFVAYMGIKPCEQKVFNKWLKKTEKKMRRYRIKHTEFVYACKAVGEKPYVDVEKLLATKYPAKEIYDIIKLYFDGKAEMAIQSARKLKVVSNNTDMVDQAKKLEKQLMIINGKYSEGVSLLLEDRLTEAQKKFGVSLKTDADVIPKELSSYYREEISKRLAKKLYQVGLDVFKRGGIDNRQPWADAFEYWMKCLATRADDTNCMAGLNRLEQAATELNEKAGVLEDRGDNQAFDLWESVLKITRPVSLPYKKAKQKLDEYSEE